MDGEETVEPGPLAGTYDLRALDDRTLQSVIEEGLRRTNICICVLNREKRIMYISPSVATWLGRSQSSVLGRSGRELGFPEDLTRKVESLVDGAFASERSLHGEMEAEFRGRKIYFEYDVFRLSGGRKDPFAVMGLITNRTEERRAQTFTEALNRINLEISRLSDPSAIMSMVVDIAGTSMGGDPMGLILREEGVWTARYAYALPSEAAEYRVRWAYELLDRSLDTGEPLVIGDVRELPQTNNEVAERFEVRSLMSFPIRVSDKLEGALLFFRQREVRPYSPAEIDFGRRLAASVAVALGNSLMYRDVKRSEEEKAALLEQIRSEKELLLTMMESTGVPIALLEGDDARIVMCNAAYRLAVQSPEGPASPEGRPMRDVVCTEEYERGMKLYRGVLRSGSPSYNVDHWRTDQNGDKRHYLMSLVPLRSKEGPRILLVGPDITDTIRDKNMIEELAVQADAERKRLRAIINNLPVGVLIADGDGNIIESNQVRDLIWGGDTAVRKIPEDLKNLRGRWADTGIKVADEEWPIYRAFKNKEKVVDAVVDIHRLDDSRGTMLMSAAPIFNEAGQHIGAVAVMHDITSQRRLEHEAVEAKERAELYLDLLVHDIGNLNTVTSGFIQRSKAPENGKETDGRLQRALAALSESSRLIDNVRKLQMVESRELARTMVDLGWVLEDIAEEQRARTGDRVRIDYRPQLGMYVTATALIKDVFVNIIGNAVKHSGGPVTVNVALGKAFEGGQEMYKAVIEDDGPGIPDEVKSQVFMRKFRGSRSGGCGLGLYLVKRLVEDFNGRVWVEDRVPGDPTKGARFVVMLPAAGVPGL